LEHCGLKEIVTTNVFLRKDNTILLAMKKHGHGEGHWNGAGGKVDPGETVAQAMVRESEEEIGVTPTSYRKVAESTYYQIYKGEPCKNTSHIYLCSQWEGEPTESDEMAPQWFETTAIPYNHMWPDAKDILPRLLDGQLLHSVFRYSPTNNQITSTEITEVDHFDEP
jgi:mutator protein MutT